MTWPLLGTIVFLPLLGAVVLLALPRRREALMRGWALGVMLVTFAVSVVLYAAFDRSLPGMQFSEQARWIDGLGITYHVGIDGISLPLFVLTTLLSPIALMGAWQSVDTKVKEFAVLMLVLETSMLGAFVALDLFLFFIFWEAMLIPMYLMIGIWGGENRLYATVKFILYTMAGSALMLVAILALHVLHLQQGGGRSFDLFDFFGLDLSLAQQKLLFMAFFLSFAIKVPLFPFHTWLPDAHTEAPTAGSVILAGVLLKMGGYGFIRFCLPLFPAAAIAFAPLIAVLAVIGILYGALVAMVQPDLKRLVAYSSVSHLGLVMLGIFAGNLAGLQGGILQMVNHGLTTGALFLLVGIIYERRHTREIAALSGLATTVPIFAVFFAITMFSSIGLPGLNGFVGEFLILVGMFKTNVAYASLAVLGIILGAAYMLWLYQRTMFGEATTPENQTMKDMNVREIGYMLPLVILMFWIGLYPRPYLNLMRPTVDHYVTQMQERHLAEKPVASAQRSVTRTRLINRESLLMPQQLRPTEYSSGIHEIASSENQRQALAISHSPPATAFCLSPLTSRWPLATGHCPSKAR
jgi:NADH-quinone oxidoreductase subunit M